jgi:predicted dehydrogenase
MIRIGIIGAGPNAAGHARYFATCPRTKLVAIADPALPLAEALARELSARAVSDFNAFLDDVDAVVVSSPNFLHREHAVAVARAGKHLFCEKPMGLDLAEARAIAAAVRAAKVASQVGFSPRCAPNLQAMARRARAGDFGTLLSATSHRLMWMDHSKTAGWRADPAKSGGLLMEINIHELDWLMFVGGPVESVSAKSWSAKPGHRLANDHLWVTLQFANGAVGRHEGGWLSPLPNYYRSVIGTAGAANTDEWGGHCYLYAIGKDRTDADPGPAFDLRADFLDACEGRGPAACDADWGVQVTAVAEATLLSASRDGAPVRPADLAATAATR